MTEDEGNQGFLSHTFLEGIRNHGVPGSTPGGPIYAIENCIDVGINSEIIFLTSTPSNFVVEV